MVFFFKSTASGSLRRKILKAEQSQRRNAMTILLNRFPLFQTILRIHLACSNLKVDLIVPWSVHVHAVGLLLKNLGHNSADALCCKNWFTA